MSSIRGELAAAVALLSPLTLLLVAGCGEAAAPNPVRACNDYRQAWAQRAVDDCGQVGSHQTVYDRIDAGFAQAGAANGCADAVKISDPEAFDDTCLPGLRSLACDKLAAGDLPLACKDQILFVDS